MIDLKNLLPKEYLKEDKNPCWKGYEMIGMKKNGKKSEVKKKKMKKMMKKKKK